MSRRHWFAVAVVVAGWALSLWGMRRADAREDGGVRAWVIYDDGPGAERVVKIQDGECIVYVSYAGYGQVGGRATSVAVGRGCR